ncbi:MAG: RNA polymerase sigma factor [Pirellulaceae bacterium]
MPADPLWLAELFTNHQPGLRRFIVGVVRDRSVAEEIVQSTFAKAAESAAELEPRSVKAWLYRVAFHEAISFKRRLQVDRKAMQALAPATVKGSEFPEDALVQKEQAQQVRQAIDELPEKQRQVVLMRIYEQKTFAQIAEETDTPLGTVLVYMQRALERLRQKLQRHHH